MEYDLVMSPYKSKVHQSRCRQGRSGVVTFQADADILPAHLLIQTGTSAAGVRRGAGSDGVLQQGVLQASDHCQRLVLGTPRLRLHAPQLCNGFLNLAVHHSGDCVRVHIQGLQDGDHSPGCFQSVFLTQPLHPCR